MTKYDIKTDNRAAFEQFVIGKSIAIVGRAEYLNDLDQGSHIDGFDVVIRAHSNLPYPSTKFHLNIDSPDSFVPMSHHTQLGKRTDAFAPADFPFWNIGYVDEVVPKLQDRGCQWIIQHKIYNVPTAQSEPGIRERLSVIDYCTDKYIPVYVASEQNFHDLMRSLDYSFPMPGTVLINEILKMNPAKLFVTGFSCYADNKHQWLKAEVSLFRDHKPLYDLRYLRELYRSGIITTDSVMPQYFKEI